MRAPPSLCATPPVALLAPPRLPVAADVDAVDAPQANDEIGSRAQLLCAECLGLLGAVDPARLSVKTRLPEELYTEPDELLIALISKHLVRLLRVAPSLQVLDSATFAIQVRKQRARPESLTAASSDAEVGDLVHSCATLFPWVHC